MTATWINPNDPFEARNEAWQAYLRHCEGTQWSLIVKQARADRAERVAARPANSYSLSFLAQDYGLVPHNTESCIGCAATTRRLADAAAIISFEYRHPNTRSIWHATAWEIAR